MKNLLFLHGGGPTAVLNASLYGAVDEAKKHPSVGKILAARGGSGGLLRRSLIDLRAVPDSQLRLLPFTPGSAIGSSRDHLEEPEYREIARLLREEKIDCLLPGGGNGTMDTAGKIWRACREMGFDIQVVGIPKTMDNDIAVTDHAPGYGSAARFIAGSARELAADIRSLPIHVVILETSGRNAGWVAAASALADQGDGLGPDLILLPERPFSKERFLQAVEGKLKEKSGLLVVASEGLRDEKGEPVAEPAFTAGRDVYFGDVGGALAGESGKMAAIRRLPGEGYQTELFLTPFESVMLHEKKLPEGYISPDGFGVTESFKRYALPLTGGALPEMAVL